MQIGHVEQNGTKVHAYDENGNELFKKSGELIFFVSNYVLVRRGNKICQLDAFGYVLDANFVLKIGRVRYNDTEIDAYDQDDNKIFTKPGKFVDFTEDGVRVKRENKIYTYNPYGELLKVEDPPIGCLGWLMLSLISGLSLFFIVRCANSNNHTKVQ
uniref:hypothetical protein n=1 Tax=Helicobacter suis TaxID=104628 RepID=UPI0013D50B3E